MLSQLNWLIIFYLILPISIPVSLFFFLLFFKLCITLNYFHYWFVRSSLRLTAFMNCKVVFQSIYTHISLSFQSAIGIFTGMWKWNRKKVDNRRLEFWLYVCERKIRRTSERERERVRERYSQKRIRPIIWHSNNSQNMIKLWNIAPIPQSRDKILIDFNEILLQVKLIWGISCSIQFHIIFSSSFSITTYRKYDFVQCGCNENIMQIDSWLAIYIKNGILIVVRDWFYRTKIV